MKSKLFLIIILLSGVAGIIFFLVQRNYVIVQVTSNPFASPSLQAGGDVGSNRPIKIYFWKHDKWLTDDATVLWNQQDVTSNTSHVIKQWLLTLQDEHLVSSHILVESVSVDDAGSEVYVSFDHSLFAREWSIHQKWKILESLFKTLRFAITGLQTMVLLVHHQPMQDDHLMLDQPLPIQERS